MRCNIDYHGMYRVFISKLCWACVCNPTWKQKELSLLISFRTIKIWKVSTVSFSYLDGWIAYWHSTPSQHPGNSHWLKEKCRLTPTMTLIFREFFLFVFFSILYLTSSEIIFTIYNFIYIVLITFAIETN